MKTISLTEFQQLVSGADWHFSQNFEVTERFYDEAEDPETLETIAKTEVQGIATKTSTCGDFKITYSEYFSYVEYDEKSLETTEDEDSWELSGFSVVDDDDEELSASDIAEYLDSRFSDINYDALNIAGLTDIDVLQDSDMKTYTITIDNAPNIRFTGDLIAEVSSASEKNTGRWTELALYKTAGGNFICHQIGRTVWQGEHDRFSGKACKSVEEVTEFFGFKKLAKDLYEEAGIDTAIDIE